MAYIPVGEDESMLGSFSCGTACRCESCRPGISGLAERYIPEEDERPEPGQTGGYYSLGLIPVAPSGVTTGGLRQRQPMVFPPTTIRVQPFFVLDRFLHNQARPMPFHTPNDRSPCQPRRRELAQPSARPHYSSRGPYRPHWPGGLQRGPWPATCAGHTKRAHRGHRAAESRPHPANEHHAAESRRNPPGENRPDARRSRP